MSKEKVGRVVSTDRSPSFLEVDVRLDPGKMVSVTRESELI